MGYSFTFSAEKVVRHNKVESSASIEEYEDDFESVINI